MTMLGKTAWNKGKKFPHSKEWEEKRILAVRAAAKRRPSKKGIARPREHVEPMLKALAESRKKDPAKFQQAAVKNLPKDCDGEKNGNWKGGITARTRGARHSKQYQQWRRACIKRDGHKCKLCPATKELQVHHIVAVSENPRLITLPMNGVTLCKKCHYENDPEWKGVRHKTQPSVNSMVFIYFIPHKLQTYETIGNWQILPDGTIVIFVSRLVNPRFEMLVALHELVETFLCKNQGVTQKQVDAFDFKFEANRKPGDESEPGDAPQSPYQFQHGFSTSLERMLCAALKIPWSTYEDACNTPLLT